MRSIKKKSQEKLAIVALLRVVVVTNVVISTLSTRLKFGGFARAP